MSIDPNVPTSVCRPRSFPTQFGILNKSNVRSRNESLLARAKGARKVFMLTREKKRKKMEQPKGFDRRCTFGRVANAKSLMKTYT